MNEAEADGSRLAGLIAPRRSGVPARRFHVGEGRRWLVATGLAVLLESSILGAIVWSAEHVPVPPPPRVQPKPIQVFMATALPAAAPPVLAQPVVVSAPPSAPAAESVSEPVIRPETRSARQTLTKSPAPKLPAKSVAAPKVVPKVASRSKAARRHEPRRIERRRQHAVERIVPPEQPKRLPMPQSASSAVSTAPVEPTRPIPPGHAAPVPMADLGDLIRVFGGRLSRAIQRNLRYPPAAQAMGRVGRTQVQFWVVAGRIRDVRVATSSGSSVLDEAAVAAVRTLANPPVPAALADRKMPFMLWVRFDPV